MGRWRKRAVRGLVVLGSVLAFLSVLAIWTERQALNTDDWVRTSDELIADETIRAEVGEYLVDQLYENVDVEKELEGILPGDLKDLAGPASGGLRQVAGDGAQEVLKSSTAQDLWQQANRLAHEELLAVLEDEKEALSTSGGEVTLKLGTLVSNLANEVGIGGEVAERLPEDAGEITVLRSDELGTAQDIAIGVRGLALVLSILTFLTLGLAIYLARGSRWVTVLFCGVGLIAAGFAVVVFRQIAGGIVVDQLVEDPSIRPAAESAWSIATSLMVSISTSVIVVGFLFGIAGWLGSPTGSARASRGFFAPILRDHVAYAYAALAVLVCIYFLLSPTQNLRTLLTTLIVAGIAAFGIHELRRQTREEFPDASFDDLFGGLRERISGAVKSTGERASKLRLPEVRRDDAGADSAEPGRGEQPPAGPIVPPPPSGDEPETAEQRPAAPPPGGAGSEEDSRLARLERLAELHRKGVLTDEEFAAEKARLLGR